MAEFGTQATQLSAPQGAGSTPLAPVQEQAVNTSMLPMVAHAAPALAQGISNIFQAQAAKVQEEYVQEYSNALKVIEGSGLPPSETMARVRATTAMYKQKSQFADAIEKARKTRLEGTDLGLAESQEKTEFDLRKEAKAAAQRDGIEFYPGMDPAAENALLRAHAQQNRYVKNMELEFKINAEKRAQGTYDLAADEALTKRNAVAGLNDIVTSRYEGAEKVITDIKQKIASGQLSFDGGQLAFKSHFNKIYADIASISGTNQALGNEYRSMFGNLEKLGEQLLDPKADSARIQGQIQGLVNRQKLSALQNDPLLQRTVAASELFQNSPFAANLAFKTTPKVTSVVSRMLQESTGVVETNPVIGNSEVEGPALGILKEGIKGSAANKGNAKYETEVFNGVNNTIKQLSNLPTNISATQLATVSNFIGSPEFGRYMAENKGKVDPQVLKNATGIWETNYRNVGIDTVQEQIKSAFDRFNQRRALGAGVIPETFPGQGGKEPTQSAIDVNKLTVSFSGGGLVFGLKDVGNDPQEIRNAQMLVSELNKSREAINSFIRQGTHIGDDPTNYQKHWEENKHIYFPNVFSRYNNLELGKVVDGMKYIGGNAADKDSWVPVK